MIARQGGPEAVPELMLVADGDGSRGVDAGGLEPDGVEGRLLFLGGGCM